MQLKRLIRILFIIVSAGALLACAPMGPGDDETGAPGVDLAGTEWMLTSLQGEPPIADTELTLEFQDGEIAGSAGCNTFGGTYTVEGTDLTITELFATEIGCMEPEGIMQQEQTYLETLRQAAGYTVTDGELTLTDDTGDVILTYTRAQASTLDPALTGSDWALVSFNGEPPLDEATITLSFEQDEVATHIGGFAGCNSYGGEVTSTSDGTFSIEEVEQTAMACGELGEGIMAQEAAYIDALTQATAYTVDRDRLEITDADGQTELVYERQLAYDMNPDDLIGTEWSLTSLDGEELLAGTTITLGFHDEHLASGHAGCRDYVITYSADGDDLNSTQTSMFGTESCLDDDALLQQEGTYTTMLSWVSQYRLTDGRLELFTERGETLTFEPLPADVTPAFEGTTWALGGFIDVRADETGETPILLVTTPVMDTTPTVTFQDGQVAGLTGCNRFNGRYMLEDGRLTIDELEWTDEGCNVPEGAAEQEQRYLDALQQADTYRLLAGQLWLETNDGSTLAFMPEAS